MNEWTFRIDEQPVPKGRARIAPGGKFAYTPKKTRVTEAVIRVTAREKWNRPPIPKGTAISLICMFGYVRPKAHYIGGSPEKGLNLTGKKPAPKHHTQKPDMDNLVKLLKDALNKIVWDDDAQVCSTFARKVWLEEGPSRMELVVSWA